MYLNKRGMEMWQIVMIILALLLLFFIILFYSGLKDSIVELLGGIGNWF
ncbi:MAG: hypothetical protein ABIG93_01770 [archaeon]|nr:hypothetical protein [Nanoarchaeota archaeon]